MVLLFRGHSNIHDEANKQLSMIINDGRVEILQSVNYYFVDTLSDTREERALARLEAAGVEDGSTVDLSHMLKNVRLSNE